MSSEEYRDVLRFRVNGYVVRAITGERDWTEVTVELNPREISTLSWEYEKDGSGDGGLDCGMIRDLKITYEAQILTGDVRCTAGKHRVLWDMDIEGFRTEIRGDLAFEARYGEVRGISPETELDIPCDPWYWERDGLRLRYSPLGGERAVVKIDGKTVLTATNSGEYVWRPMRIGYYTITHKAGDTIWETEIWNSYVYGNEYYEPDPPEPTDGRMSISQQKFRFGVEGGSNGFRVKAVDGAVVQWEASTWEDWISIEGGNFGEAGKDSVRYSVEQNFSANSRTGYVYVGGHVHTVTQDGAGLLRMDEGMAFEKDGGEGAFAVEAPNGIWWEAVSRADWISVVEGTGCDTGTVRFAVAPWHEPSTRTGEIRIGGNSFKVEQRGKMVDINCSLWRSGWEGSEFEIEISPVTGTELGEAAITAPEWVVLRKAGDTDGNCVYKISIAVNPEYGQRSGVVNVCGETLRIVQSGKNCMISETAYEFEATGGVAEFAVSVQGDAEWSVEDIPEWLKVEGNLERTGSGTVRILAEENRTVEPRATLVTIGGYEVKIVQRGNELSLEYYSRVCGPDWGEYSIRVSAPEGLRWRAESSDSYYIELDAGEGCARSGEYVEGIGSGRIKFYLYPLEDTDPPVNGWITIGDKTVYITQKAEGTYMLPELLGEAGENGVTALLNDAIDCSLSANISNPEEYAAFREWALGLEDAGVEEVKRSGFAWLSYALKQGKLLRRAPEKVRISGYAEDGGVFEVTVEVDGIVIGEGAAAGNLSKVFAIEGTEDLQTGFSGEKIAAEVVGVKDGRVRIRFQPKAGNSGRFFFRTLMNW